MQKKNSFSNFFCLYFRNSPDGLRFILRGFFYEEEKYIERILVVVLLIPKRPSGLKNVAGFFRSKRLQFGVELESGIKGENFFEHKVCLLMSDLIRKKNGIGKRNIDGLSD